jgi:hypothetical protein
VCRDDACGAELQLHVQSAEVHGVQRFRGACVGAEVQQRCMMCICISTMCRGACGA